MASHNGFTLGEVGRIGELHQDQPPSYRSQGGLCDARLVVRCICRVPSDCLLYHERRRLVLHNIDYNTMS